MPLLTLDIAGAPLSTAQRSTLQHGLTQLMATLLGKAAGLTVVQVRETPITAWAVGGAALAHPAWCASLDVAITAGTNSTAQQASFQAAAHALIVDAVGCAPAAPLYIVLRNVPATHWGYDGRSQASRQPRLPSSTRPLTLWQLAGNTATPPLPASGAALILIDFQREYERDGRVPLAGLGAAAHEAQGLADAAEAAGVPVVHVHHIAARPHAPLFDRDGPGAAPCPLPRIAPGHLRVTKHAPSALHDTTLLAALRERGIHTVVIAGCMTHNCVDSTARHALHLGLRVVVASDACATRALPGIDGETIAAEVVQQSALAALADRHATVLPARDIVSQWASAMGHGGGVHIATAMA